MARIEPCGICGTTWPRNCGRLCAYAERHRNETDVTPKSRDTLDEVHGVKDNVTPKQRDMMPAQLSPSLAEDPVTPKSRDNILARLDEIEAKLDRIIEVLVEPMEVKRASRLEAQNARQTRHRDRKKAEQRKDST